MGLQIREMMYHKVKMTKIMSRLTGKAESKVCLSNVDDSKFHRSADLHSVLLFPIGLILLG